MRDSEEPPKSAFTIPVEVPPEMPKRKARVPSADRETFGQRLARLRKAAGYSQRALASEIGISQRMVAYYESQSQHPPTHLLPAIADALSLSADQLLGREKTSPRKAPRNQQLLRKLRMVEGLPPRARAAVIDHIEALVEKHSRAHPGGR